MLDTQMRFGGIASDAAIGAYPRLSEAAIERAKTVLGVTSINSLGVGLGFSRMNFWRVRQGLYDIRFSHAQRVADQLGMPLKQAFDGVRDA